MSEIKSRIFWSQRSRVNGYGAWNGFDDKEIGMGVNSTVQSIWSTWKQIYDQMEDPQTKAIANAYLDALDIWDDGLINGSIGEAIQDYVPTNSYPSAWKADEPKVLDYPDPDTLPQRSDKRPKDDTRDAATIIADEPLLKNLGHQKDVNWDKLKQQVGDFEKDPDAAFRLGQVLRYIDTCKTATGKDRGRLATNGRIEGLTSKGDARAGTPAALLKDFGEQGYDALPKDHRLRKTKDKYVNDDGTTDSNFQRFTEVASPWLPNPIAGAILLELGKIEGEDPPGS